MGYFVIIHPKIGYLCKDGYFTAYLEESRRFKRKSDATQCIKKCKFNADFLSSSMVVKFNITPIDESNT